MSAGEICNRDVIYIEKEGSIREAAELMREYHVGDLVVVEQQGGQRMPVGVLTDRDLVVEVLAADVEFDRLNVGDIMSFGLVTAREEDDILDVIRQMRTHGVRRVPIVGREGELVGILALDDLLELFSEMLTGMYKAIAKEQRKERAVRQ